MCLAVPMKLVEINGQSGVVEMWSTRSEIMLIFTPEAKPGDYLIVHAGYALEVLNTAEAERTLKMFREIAGAES